MNTPPKCLTVEALTEWIETERAKLYELRDGAWHCRTCQTLANGQGCAVSLHAIEFGSECVGFGRVDNIVLPSCPTCEPVAPAWVSTCVHLPMIDARFLAFPVPIPPGILQ